MALHAAGYVHAVDSNMKACCATGAKLCRSLARLAAYQLISRLTVDVENVSAAFNLDAPIATLAPAADFVPSGVWHPRADSSGSRTSSSAAATPELTAASTTASRAVRFQPDEPLGSCARVSLRSLTVNSATPQGYGVLATVCQLSGVDLAVDRPHAAGAAGEHRICMHSSWKTAVAEDHMACTTATTSLCNHQSECCFQIFRRRAPSHGAALECSSRCGLAHCLAHAGHAQAGWRDTRASGNWQCIPSVRARY